MTQEDTPATIDVLANDAEIDDELLKVSSVTQGTSGSVTLDDAGTVIYTPNVNFCGTDTFS